MKRVIVILLIVFASCTPFRFTGNTGCGLQVCPVCNHDCYYNTMTIKTEGSFVYDKWTCTWCDLVRWVKI